VGSELARGGEVHVAGDAHAVAEVGGGGGHHRCGASCVKGQRAKRMANEEKAFTK
jgi:hypothetical protein